MPDTSLAILVVEDDPLNRTTVTRMLLAKGHRVTAVGTGDEAIALIQGISFDLLVCAAALPLGDGAGLIARVRQLAPPADELPVIALTAPPREEMRQPPPAAGADICLRKPFTSEQLCQGIFAALESRGAAQASDHSPLPAVPPGLEGVYLEYLDDLPVRMGLMSEGLENGTLDEVARLAHGLKGSSGFFNENAVRERAERLETAAGEKQTPERLGALLEELKHAVAETLTRNGRPVTF